MQVITKVPVAFNKIQIGYMKMLSKNNLGLTNSGSMWLKMFTGHDMY